MPHEGSEPEQGDRLLKHAFCSSFMSLDAVYTRKLRKWSYGQVLAHAWSPSQVEYSRKRFA